MTGSPQVEECVFAENGILAGARPGTIVIDCSTSLPASSTKVAAALAEAGCGVLDAPLTRTPIEAEKGTLNCIVGGPAETFAKVEPVLQAFCENIFHVGAVGSGHTLKLINNFTSVAVHGRGAASIRSGEQRPVPAYRRRRGGGRHGTHEIRHATR